MVSLSSTYYPRTSRTGQSTESVVGKLVDNSQIDRRVYSVDYHTVGLWLCRIGELRLRTSTLVRSLILVTTFMVLSQL